MYVSQITHFTSLEHGKLIPPPHNNNMRAKNCISKNLKLITLNPKLNSHNN